MQSGAQCTSRDIQVLLCTGLGEHSQQHCQRVGKGTHMN